MMSSRTLHDQAGGAYEQCTMVFDGGQAYRLFLTYNVCRAQDYFLNAANWQWLSASAFFNSYFRFVRAERGEGAGQGEAPAPGGI